MIAYSDVFPSYKIILHMPFDQINKHLRKVKKKKENAGFIRYVMLQQ